jgi:gluconate kinase
LPEAVWGEALSDVCARIAAAGRAGASAVIDDTACYRWLRDRYRTAARAAGLEPVLVALRIDRADVLRRVEANARDPVRPGVRDSVLREHLDRFEWPDGEEGALDLDARWPPDQLLDAALRLLSEGRR